MGRCPGGGVGGDADEAETGWLEVCGCFGCGGCGLEVEWLGGGTGWRWVWMWDGELKSACGCKGEGH